MTAAGQKLLLMLLPQLLQLLVSAQLWRQDCQTELTTQTLAEHPVQVSGHRWILHHQPTQYVHILTNSILSLWQHDRRCTNNELHRCIGAFQVFLLTYLLTHSLTYLITYLLTWLIPWLLACLLTNLLTYLRFAVTSWARIMRTHRQKWKSGAAGEIVINLPFGRRTKEEITVLWCYSVFAHCFGNSKQIN